MHAHHDEPPGVDIRTWLRVGIAVVAALTVLGLIVLWPRGEAPEIGPAPNEYLDGTIVDTVPDDRCSDIEIVNGFIDCVTYHVQVSSGPDPGDEVQFSVRPTQVDVPDLETGDRIVLRYYPDSPVEFRYAFYDFQRATPMLWLLAGFVVVVLAFGRFQGLRALTGLGLSLAVLVTFVVPALLRESSPIMVALVGSAVVAYLAIYLAHGFGITSTIALAGTLASLAITSVLAIVVAGAAQLSGLASQEAQTLSITTEALDLRGLLLAGIVIGTLGVLDDVTVSQVSTVAALRRANPLMRPRALYVEANRVGRDHVASAVNTLVLAYAGASLPLLLWFAQGNQPIGRLLTGELVSLEFFIILVGSIGLVLSVPITTALASLLLSRTADIPEDDGHGHHHGHLPEPAPVAAATHQPSQPAWEGPHPERVPVEPWF